VSRRRQLRVPNSDPVKIAALSFALLVAIFLGVTLWALEGQEVAVLRTFDASGRLRETRTWIADEGNFAWIEAANPQRPFLLMIQARPEVELIRAGRTQALRALPVPTREGHEKIRRLLEAKYGWADCWIGFLTDTSNSVAIRLEPR